MSYKFMIKSCLAAVFAAVVVVSPAYAAPFTNGSFEDPPVAAGDDALTFNTPQTFGGWSVVSGGVDLVKTIWEPADGAQSLDLNAGQPGSIEQTFDTVPGEDYTVTFALAGNPVPPTVKTGVVSIDGVEVFPFSFDITGRTVGDMGWTEETFSFTATGTQTTIAFTSTTLTAFGPAIDNISIVTGSGVTEIVAEPTILRLGPSLGLNLLKMSARLTHEGAPLPGKTVVFSAGAEPICSADTNAAGVATCSGLVEWLQAVLAIRYRATFVGDVEFAPATTTAPLIILLGLRLL